MNSSRPSYYCNHSSRLPYSLSCPAMLLLSSNSNHLPAAHCQQKTQSEPQVGSPWQDFHDQYSRRICPQSSQPTRAYRRDTCQGGGSGPPSCLVHDCPAKQENQSDERTQSRVAGRHRGRQRLRVLSRSQFHCSPRTRGRRCSLTYGRKAPSIALPPNYWREQSYDPCRTKEGLFV